MIDGQNRLAQVGSTSIGFDGRGNLNNDGGASYSYNANNLLTSMSTGATLSYDAENRLHSIAKNGTVTQFLYDGSDMIAEYDGSGNQLRRYVHGPGDDEPVVWYELSDSTNPKRYLNADNQGSITSVTNGSGSVLNTTNYSEYGLMTPSNGTYQSRFSYTGQMYLPEIGMYYYKGASTTLPLVVLCRLTRLGMEMA